MEREPTDTATIEGARQQFDFLKSVVEGEDYATGMRQHDALMSGLMDNVLFGRNEGGGQTFHRWTERLVAASDEELKQMFASQRIAEAAE